MMLDATNVSTFYYIKEYLKNKDERDDIKTTSINNMSLRS